METKETNTTSIWNKSGEARVNLSEKYKSFLWLWDKTGTSLAKEIFSHFNFSFYDFSESPKKIISDTISQFHYCGLFQGHENYLLIATARNPYTRLFSRFVMNFPDNKITIEDFQTFVEEFSQSPNNLSCCDFEIRKPDFFIRVENLYTDYCKIPFINESELKKNGTLMILCNNLVNKGRGNFNWKNFYNQSIADMVFYSCQKYFDLLDYDKNSWKK